ncbi:MAG: hypothetical protein ACYDC8_02920 [Gammaproteobacteria bacterium]
MSEGIEIPIRFHKDKPIRNHLIGAAVDKCNQNTAHRPDITSISDKEIDRWCERHIVTWLDKWGTGTVFTDAVFGHKIPFHLITLADRLGIRQVSLSGAIANYLGIPKAGVLSIEQIKDALVRWRTCYVAHSDTILEICALLPNKTMLCKGAALKCLAPSYQRFAADIDLETENSGNVVDFARQLILRDYHPDGLLRFRTGNGPFLHLTLRKKISDLMVYVSLSVGFIDAYPCDYGSVTGHPYVQESLTRARSAPEMQHCLVPLATDWLVRFLLEMTGNNGVRLRDIVDLNVFLYCSSKEVDWTFFYDQILRFGLEPFWFACLTCLREAGLPPHIFGIPEFPISNRYKFLSNGLMPRVPQRALIRATIPQGRFLLHCCSGQMGIAKARKFLFFTHARNLAYRLTGATTHKLLSLAWVRPLLFPATAAETHWASWHMEDLAAISVGIDTS